MEKIQIMEFCRGVASRNKTTKAERKQIRELAKQFGISLNLSCSNCYVDACITICHHLTSDASEEPAHSTATPECDYELNEGVDVIFGGIRVNKYTLTNDLAKKLIGWGFNLSYFKKVKNNDNK